jgi:hypothetical protein
VDPRPPAKLVQEKDLALGSSKTSGQCNLIHHNGVLQSLGVYLENRTKFVRMLLLCRLMRGDTASLSGRASDLSIVWLSTSISTY